MSNTQILEDDDDFESLFPGQRNKDKFSLQNQLSSPSGSPTTPTTLLEPQLPSSSPHGHDTIRRLTAAEISYKDKEGPKRVRNYILGDILGEGSYGKVREA